MRRRRVKVQTLLPGGESEDVRGRYQPPGALVAGGCSVTILLRLYPRFVVGR
jgi:hypothetical protein